MPTAYHVYVLQNREGRFYITIPVHRDGTGWAIAARQKKDRGFITSGFTQLGEELAPGQ